MPRPSKPFGRAPFPLRRVAAASALFMSLHLPAQAGCSPSPQTTVSVDTSSTVTISCPNEQVTIQATVDAPTGTGLTNDFMGGRTSPIGTITVDGALKGLNALDLLNTTLAGDLVNNGLIQSTAGQALLEGVEIQGTLRNGGSIVGQWVPALQISASLVPLLVNAGTMSSSSDTLRISNGTVITDLRNDASGSITGDNAILFDGGATQLIGLLDNRGTVQGTTYGIKIDGAYVERIGNAQGALIHGDQIGLRAESGTLGDIDNAGRIEGGQFGFSLFQSTMNGTLTNSATGVISGGETGVQLHGPAVQSHMGAIVNAGLIEGQVGIDGHEGSVLTHGIVNTGTISGTLDGVAWYEGSQLTGGLVNAGTIQGGRYAIRVDPDGASVDRIDITGTHARLVGDVSAHETDLFFKTGAQFTTENAFDVRNLIVEPGARLVLTDAPHTGEGLPRSGVTVAQSFTNNGTVAIRSTTSAQVRGNYAQSTGGTLEIAVDSDTQYGRLKVSGQATFAPATTVSVRAGSATLTDGARLQAVVKAGTLSVSTTPGTGLTVVDNSALYDFTADTSRNANELDLVVARVPDPFPVPQTPDAPSNGVAKALNQLFPAGVPLALQPAFARLDGMSPEAMAAALSQLAPTLQGSGPQAGLYALRTLNRIIQSRIESNQGLSAGDAPADRFLWVRPFGTEGRQTDQGAVPGFKSRTAGFVFGGDAPVNDRMRAGLALLYARSDIDSLSRTAPSGADVNTYELTHYGSYNLDPVTDINYQVDAGWNRIDGLRQLLFMGSQARGSYGSFNLHGALGIGRTLQLSQATSVTPSIRYDYTRMKVDAYTESGAGGLNLNVGAATFRESMLTFDLKGSHRIDDRSRVVGNVSAGYDFLNRPWASSASFVGGGPVFQTAGLASSPWLYRAGLGYLLDRQGIEYSLRYDLERRTSGYTNQTLSARVRWVF